MENQLNTGSVVKKLSNESMKKNIYTLIISLVVVLFGGVTGWLLSGGNFSKSDSAGSNLSETVSNDREAGAKDETQFSTTTEGILREGGIKGEGTHFLERPGGESQNAYLTSTSLDMSPFVGAKVKVWGETISGLNAGWLIDVGKIKKID